MEYTSRAIANRRWRAYCRATGIALADVYNEYGPGEYDGIHPGDAGHEHIANAYIKAIDGQPSEPRIESQTVAADLKDNGDGTVSDTTTGLTWTRSADLAKAEKHAADTEEFIAQFNASATFGHKNWRLPAREEMLNLVDPANRQPALPNSSPFESVSGWYRTSTTDWGIDMDHGIPWSSGKAKEKIARIWLVRETEQVAGASLSSGTYPEPSW